MSMGQTALPQLASWTNFYEITGSSAGALTGLQFVVIILIAQAQAAGSSREIRAFGTPTVVHFCAALLISGLMSAPWHSFLSVAACLGICSTAGTAYAISIVWHAYKAAYQPDTEDWIWYVALPLIAYGALIAAAILLRSHTAQSLFAIAAITLTFLFIGIHNSWDTVAYIALKNQKATDPEASKQ